MDVLFYFPLVILILHYKFIMGRAIKLTYTFVECALKKEGYTLVSTSYINAVTSLYVLCPLGHKTTIKWREFKAGCRCRVCSYIQRGIKQTGNKNFAWKGGVESTALPLYKTYAEQLENYQTVYLVTHENLELLGVSCIYCGNIFVPTSIEVKSRLMVIKGKRAGENNFYCSQSCKQACPTYNQKKYPKGFKLATSREVQPELRKLVLRRDNYRCQKCSKGSEEVQLHCHHIDPVINNPIESADLDNCVTLCKSCHKEVHKLPNCTYTKLKCNNL